MLLLQFIIQVSRHFESSLCKCSWLVKHLYTQSCLTLCDPMNCSTPGLRVHHQPLEFLQTYVHWVGDAIQPSHPSTPSSVTLKKIRYLEELMVSNCAAGEDSWESLDSKETKPDHPKGNQSWIFTGSTDAEAETPILWPPDSKNWPIWNLSWCSERLSEAG